jgi:hypothetical protein
MMNSVRKHAATIVVAMVTAAATAGGTAIAGQIINADKLNGYRADQLIRAAEKHRDGGVLRSARGKGGSQILSVNVTAPKRGYLVMAASSDVFLPGGARGVITSEISTCFLDLNGVEIVSSQRTMRLEADDGNSDNESNCATNSAWPVASGQHTVRLMAQSSGSTIYDEASLNVLYVPFNGKGNVPDPEPVQPPAAAGIGNN